MAIRKSFSVVCDVKGCQGATAPMPNRTAARVMAIHTGWQLYTDTRKKERARCIVHKKDLRSSQVAVILES